MLSSQVPASWRTCLIFPNFIKMSIYSHFLDAHWGSKRLTQPGFLDSSYQTRVCLVGCTTFFNKLFQLWGTFFSELTGEEMRQRQAFSLPGFHASKNTVPLNYPIHPLVGKHVSQLFLFTELA